MATARFFFSTSILLFSLLVIIASATDFGYTPNPETAKPDNVYGSLTPKPENTKPDSGYGPTPKSDYSKPQDGYSSKPKPENIKSDSRYGSTPLSDDAKPEDGYSQKPKPENTISGYGHGPKPNLDGYKPKPYSGKPDYGYAQAPKSESEYVSKPETNSVKPENGYDPNSKPDTAKPDDNQTDVPKPEIPLPVGVEGLVLCKSGSNYVPIVGAVARITCSLLGHSGYDATPFSCLTSVTDAKGYFLKVLPELGLGDNLKLTDCKVKLEKSPLQGCNIPTDVNKGINGALLSSYHILHDKKIKLYSVGPFFYTTSQPKPTPIGY